MAPNGVGKGGSRGTLRRLLSALSETQQALPPVLGSNPLETFSSSLRGQHWMDHRSNYGNYIKDKEIKKQDKKKDV